MLFPYSQKGLAHNWLSPSVLAVLCEGLDNLDKGEKLPEWLDKMPAEKVAWLKPKYGFSKKLKAFWAAYGNLTIEKKAEIRQALKAQTDLPAILSSDLPCKTFSGDPAMEAAITDLFEYLFAQLSDPKEGAQCIRDRQYSALYDELPARICPFCGLLPLRAPKGPRHALDHFLAISLYPFAGADLRNLTPMCDDCNRTFKGAEDVLHDQAKVRRRCSDPYSGPSYSINLVASAWGAGAEVRGFKVPRWKIDFVGGPPEQGESWDAIFKIRDRYRRDVLDPEFMSWTAGYARWFKTQHDVATDEDGVASKLKSYAELTEEEGFSSQAFLKAGVFELLHVLSNDPVHGDDVKGWLLCLVKYT